MADTETNPSRSVPRSKPAAHRSVHDRPRWLSRLLGAGFVLAAVGLLVWSWLPKPVSVDIETAQRGHLVQTVDEDGRARVKDRYVVSAPLSGNLARIELHPGDAVQEGDPLARIVPLSAPLLDERSRLTAKARLEATRAAQRQSLAQVERTETALAFAKEEAKRSQELLAQNVISQREVDLKLLEVRTLTADLASARFGSKVAQHELEMARAALGHLKNNSDPESQLLVTAPIAGQVLQVIQRSEGVIQAGAPLLEVGNPIALEVVVDLLTQDAVRVRPGAAVRLERWGGAPLDGRVRLVEPSAFTRVSSLGVEEQRVNVIVDLESDLDLWRGLGDGYRVEARVVVWEGQDVLSVPSSAVFRDGDRWAVYAVVEGRTERRFVETGHRTRERVEITGGLDESSRVVLHPSDRVQDGVQVQAR